MLEMMRQHLGDKAPARRLSALTALRGRYLIDTEKWNTPPASWETDVNQLGPAGRAYWTFVSGLSALKRGDREAGARALAAFSAANAASGTKNPTDVIPELELKALMKLAEGERDDAVALMRQATAREDAMPFEFGPPVVPKPSHELFGEILLQMGRAKEAEVEFRRALALAPKRARSLLGLARASAIAGDRATATEAQEALRAIWHRADAELGKLAEAPAAMK
jgi:tetratricopeptide (TPR) repeat protein